MGTVAYDSVDIVRNVSNSLYDHWTCAMKCRYCGNLRDAGIQDNIPVCHVCWFEKGGIKHE